MVKLSVLFYRPLPDRLAEFEAGYTRFLALVEDIPHIQRRQVVDVLRSARGESKFYRVLEIYFEDHETLNIALNAEAGQRAGAGLYEVFKPRGYRFETMISDVYEETGGSTPPTTRSTQTGGHPTT